MSDINLGFTVETSNINVVVDTNEITFTPSDIQLTVAQAILLPGGANGQLQYNNLGVMGGVANTNYDGSNLTLGNVSNVKITGGVNGYFLQTDGTGNLAWAAGGGGGGNGTPGGSNTQVQYNDNGTFGGNAGFTFNEVTGQLSVIDLSAGNAGITGSLSAGTLSAGNLNITGNTLTQNMNSNANVIGVNFTANGNISVSGNANITGNISANNATFSNLTLNSNVVHLGANAGSNSGPFTTAIGAGAGDNNQGFGAIAIGVGAGVAGNGQYSIAIGADAGLGVQANSAIAIGTAAGLRGQSDYVIAIGANAGYDGASNAQANNTIVLNATGANLVGNAFANAFYVKPVRNANTANLMFYNPTTGELSYDTQSNITVSVAQTVSNNAQPNITSVGTLSSLTVNGNANVTGNANIGNVNTTAVVATRLGGSLTTNAQPNITSVGTLTNLTSSGNITGTNIIGTTTMRSLQFVSNVASGTAPLVVTSTTRVANLNVAQAGIAENLSNPSADLLVNSVTANSYVVPVANTTGSLGFTGQRWGNLFVITITSGNITASGNISATNGNITGANLNTSGKIVGTNGGDLVLNSSVGATEGSQITLAWKGVTGLTGQGNSTWNLDSEGSNNFRIFSVDSSGNPRVNMTAYSANTDVAFSGNVSAGNTSATYNKLGSTTFGSLVAASTIGIGAKTFITDANTTTFYSLVSGGGSNIVPVFSDGTNWRVG